MTNIQVNIDETTKTAIDSLFTSLGLDTSTAVKLFFNKVLEINGLPFAVKHLTPNDDFFEAIEDSRSRRNLVGPFNTVGEAMQSLLED